MSPTDIGHTVHHNNVGYTSHRQSIFEDFHARTKKSEIYSIGNFDLKFDAKQAVECKKNSRVNIGLCYTHTMYFATLCQM